MTKVYQIEQALSSIDGARFQALCDAYLHATGYRAINAVGSVAGKDKTKPGTPDTYFVLPDGKYVFAEYTTQTNHLLDKLLTDLGKCFDETKTGIPVSKIDEIILCYAGEIDTAEQETLIEKCQQQGCKVKLIGLRQLALELRHRYPSVANEFLGIEVDTGQVLPVDQFVAAYDQNRLAAPLDLLFHFREAEVDQALQVLAEQDLLLISGPAGVGKTRFALECCRRFVADHAQYQAYGLLRRDQELHSDLVAYLSPDGYYLVVADDTNRFREQQLIFDLVRQRNEDQHVKLIVTVRDYAAADIRKAAAEVYHLHEISLEQMDGNQIRTLISDAFGISNLLYLDRIVDIAHGNPRLAVMAARVAKEHNTLASIANVAELYEVYFSAVIKDVDELEQKDLWPVAATVALFRYLDRSNHDLLVLLAELLNLSERELWQRVEQLHSLETLDLYENEVVRFSDQILATYFVYQVFFVKRLAEFDLFFQRFFFPYRTQFVDAINACVGTFDANLVINALRDVVEETWSKVEDDDSLVAILARTFLGVVPTRVLLHLQQQISSLPAKVIDFALLSYKAAQQVDELSPLRILSQFKQMNAEHFQMALDLIFDYLDRRLDQLPQVLFCLVKDFGFDQVSVHRKYWAQQTVIDGLVARTDGDLVNVYQRVLLVVAREYLRGTYEEVRAEGRNTILARDHYLHLSDALRDLRSKIWSILFNLYTVPECEERVLRLLLDYSVRWTDIKDAEIAGFDSEHVLPFIATHLRQYRFFDCWVVQHYLDLLEHRHVSYDAKLRQQFYSDTYALASLLLPNILQRTGKSHQEYEEHRSRRVREYFSDYEFSDYADFLDDCAKIWMALEEDHQRYQLRGSIEQVLAILAETKPGLFVQVLGQYIGLGDPFRLNPVGMVNCLIKAQGATAAYSTIGRYTDAAYEGWVFAFYIALPEDQITPERVDELYRLYDVTPAKAIPAYMNHMVKYAAIDPKAVANITHILLAKEDHTRIAHVLDDLLGPFSPPLEKLRQSFAGDLPVLKEAYFLLCKEVQGADHDGRVFSLLLDLDPGFLVEYIQWVYQQREGHFFTWREHRDYSFLWQRTDYELLVRQAIEYVRHQQRDYAAFADSNLYSLFGTMGPERKPYAGAEQQIVLFLENLVVQSHADMDLMQIVFDVVLHVLPGRYRELLQAFLTYNQEYESFAKILSEPQDPAIWGSPVSHYQESIRFLESLIPLFPTVKLLRHRHAVEQRITHYRKRIQDEERRMFTETD